MKIAILGWGSLIWQPKALKYDRELDWDKNGPYLPIEFSRISNDGRLTLVIDDNATPVQVLFAISQYKKLDEAILDLAIREGCDKDRIGRYDKVSDEFIPNDFSFQKAIKEWIKKTDCDAVIWTNLGKRFKDKIGLTHNIENVIQYLETLPKEAKVIAEEYIRKAPEQIKTKFRKKIEEELNWKPMV